MGILDIAVPMLCILLKSDQCKKNPYNTQPFKRSPAICTNIEIVQYCIWICNTFISESHEQQSLLLNFSTNVLFTMSLNHNWVHGTLKYLDLL